MRLVNLLLSGLISACYGLTFAFDKEESFTPTFTTPLKVQNNGKSFNGGYVLKHTEDLQVFFDESLYDEDIDIDFMTLGDSTYHVYVNDIEQSSSDFNTFVDVNLFTAHYDYLQSVITVSIDYGLIQDNTDSFSFSYGDNIQDFNYSSVSGVLDCTKMAFCVTSYGYLTPKQRILFDVLFTQEETSNFFYYQGWYTFNNSANISNIGNGTIVSTITFDNGLYNYLNFTLDAPTHFINLVRYTASTSYQAETIVVMSSADAYSGEWKTNARSVYIPSALMTRTTYTNMSAVGVFAYVNQNPNDYNMTDLFIDIADTPVRFIVDLFSFELFGMQFYIAFLGIITAMAMIFIVRKFL